MSEQTNQKPASFADFKKSVKNLSPANLASLMAYIEPFDVLFVFVLIFAIFKDLADMFISLIPIIGFILSLFISIFCAILYFFVLCFFWEQGPTKNS